MPDASVLPTGLSRGNEIAVAAPKLTVGGEDVSQPTHLVAALALGSVGHVVRTRFTSDSFTPRSVTGSAGGDDP